MKKILFTLILLFGCSRKDRISGAEETVLPSYKDYIRYYKDTRTNLCFAGYNDGIIVHLISNVPCTPEVEVKIKTFTSN